MTVMAGLGAMSVKNDFTIKDNGDRMQFESGMMRDTAADKTDFLLIVDGPMLERWAEHLTKGARKYARQNWLKAEGEAELLRFQQSAIRHMIQWLRGQRDEDHAAAIFFNVNGAEYVRDKLLASKVPVSPTTPISELNNV